MSILVTGGAGYIGSHTCVELLNAGYEVVVVDNLCNSKMTAVDRVEKITGKSLKFYAADVCDKSALTKIFEENKIDAVIHFAGLKAVGESVYKPIEYFGNNVTGAVTLCDVMRDFNVKKMVFSSSATVYGSTNEVPFTEKMPMGTPTNPYGRTKCMIEDILRDIYISDNTWSIALLRYFNPIGAHESGLIGEDPNGIPNNLMPFISQVAVGRLPELSVYGDDYDTPDGTCLRDYIHVVDLAKGHIKAVEYIMSHTGAEAVNLGTGKGTSVLELVEAFERINEVKIPYKVTGRRAGDIARCYACADKAKELFGWQTELGVDDMCRDSWRWQKTNPNGYDD